MPLNQGRERPLGRLALASGEALQQLAIRQPGDVAPLEEGADLSMDGAVPSDGHDQGPPGSPSSTIHR